MYRKLLRNNISTLSPYSTARDEYKGEIGVYLDANENPYDNGYNRYPDPHQIQLKEKISQLKGVSASRIFIGNGSDEPIDLLYRIFCEPGIDNVVAIAPTYGMYRVAASINNIEYRDVQLDETDFSMNPDDILAATDSHTKLLFLCSPNNPTANAFEISQIEEVIHRFNGIVVIDEAYVDFSDKPSFSNREFENVVVLQTLSKAWAMAGLRLGLAFASEGIISVMSNVKYPYNINIATQGIVLEKLEESITSQVEEIKSERSRLISHLRNISGIRTVYASDANFVLIRVDEPRKLYDELIGRGVIVRDRSRIAGCSGCLRITVGTPAQNDKMMEIVEFFFKQTQK